MGEVLGWGRRGKEKEEGGGGEKVLGWGREVGGGGEEVNKSPDTRPRPSEVGQAEGGARVAGVARSSFGPHRDPLTRGKPATHGLWSAWWGTWGRVGGRGGWGGGEK